MSKLVMLAVTFIMLSAVFCVDPSMRLVNTTVYVEFHGPCWRNGSFDGHGGGRLRPVVVQGLAAVDQQAHVVLANVTDPVPANQEEEGLGATPDPSGHQGGGAGALHDVQQAVNPLPDLQGNF